MPECEDNLIQWVNDCVNTSLERLNSKELYGLLVHNIDDYQGPRARELFDALDWVKSRGLVKKTGVSIYSPNQLQHLYDNFSFDIVQAPINLIDRRLEKSGWLEKLKINNVEVFGKSVFTGFVIAEYVVSSENFIDGFPYGLRWENLLFSERQSARFVYKLPEISRKNLSRIIVGVDNVAHARHYSSL